MAAGHDRGGPTVEEYLETYRPLFEENDILNIFLISPQTPDERICYLDGFSKGFLYMVSSASTTGVKKGFDSTRTEYFKRVVKLNLSTPHLTGFGISDRKSFEHACTYSSGAIIGSAFINTLDKEGNLGHNIHDFIKSIR